MSPAQIRRLIIGFCAFISAASFIFIYAGVPIYTKVWHIVHGNSLQCEEFRIPVPKGWWANPLKNAGYELIAFFPGYTLHDREIVTVRFHPVTSAPSTKDKQWRQDVINRLKRDGRTCRRSVDLVIGGGAPTVCFESDLPLSHPSSEIMCNMGKRMVIDFSYEHERCKSQFYEILSGIVVSPVATPPSEPSGIGAERSVRDLRPEG
jgi:hypothetical protein